MQPPLEYEVGLIKQCLGLSLPDSMNRSLIAARSLAWIASGLSSCAAEFGRRLVLNNLGIPGTLFTPLDFIGCNTESYLPILVTYRGRNRDIEAAARKISKASENGVFLLTGFKGTPAERALRQGVTEPHVVVVPNHKEERRFVAILPTLALAALGHRLASPTQSDSDATAKTVDSLFHEAKTLSTQLVREMTGISSWEQLTWIILGGGATTAPALSAWQNALMELALTAPFAFDLKDFSHGKHLGFLGHRSIGVLLLSDPTTKHLANIVERRFSHLGPLVSVTVDRRYDAAAWQHLLIAFHAIIELSNSVRISMRSMPSFPLARVWTNWGTIR